MKCPNCGGDSLGDVCDYCGSELPREKVTINITNHYHEAPKAQPKSTPQAAPKRKTWLWVLGWIFIFPVPLTILLLRNKTMKPAVKYTLIVLGWLVYFAIGLSAEEEPAPQPEKPPYSDSSDFEFDATL